MKTQLQKSLVTISLLLSFSFSFAGPDWSRGSLVNPDNISRHPVTIAYASNGNIFVAGEDENSAGSFLITTKKYSASGILLKSVTNSYFLPQGVVVSDYVRCIALDATGNLYVLGGQYTGSARGEDMVLIKYNSSLTFQWKKYIYNPSYPTNTFPDRPSKLIFDSGNNIYVVGLWYQPTLNDLSQVVVRKYNSSGGVLYTSLVTEANDTTVFNATDMCMDANSNLTVAGMAENTSGNSLVMYARFTSSGTMSWRKFYVAPSTFSFSVAPEIECSSTGTLYISSSIYRNPAPSNYYGKILTAKFKSDGTKIWEKLSKEIHNYPNGATLKIDANNEIYTGCDFAGSTGTGAGKYRIYKYNSSGTLLWSVLSTETNCQSFTFEVFSNSALFGSFYDHQSVCPKIKKFDAVNGNVIWTESVSTIIPNGYNDAFINGGSISINNSTSEIAFTGRLTGVDGPDIENRWYICKYSATIPKLGNDQSGIGAINNELKASLFPNPANDYCNLKWNTPLSEAILTITGSDGRLIQKVNIENTIQQLTIPVYDLANGMYVACITSKENSWIQRFVVSH